MPQITELVRQAEGNIQILAGGSINAANVEEIVTKTGVREVHVRAAAMLGSEMVYRPERVTLAKSPPLTEYERSATRAYLMQEIVDAVLER